MAQRIVSRRPVQGEVGLGVRRQVEQARRPLLLAALAVLIGLVPVGALLLRGVSPDTLTRDIFATTGDAVYVGLLSNAGILGWAVGGITWLLCAVILARVAPSHTLRPLALGAGLFTLWLLADDALMLHEYVLPRLTGVPEHFFILSYGVSALALLVLGASRILRTNYLLLLLAGGLFAGSILSDELMLQTGAQLLVEDGLKFAGIVVWAAYAVDTTLGVADRLFRRR